jgi:hypothetical protein
MTATNCKNCGADISAPYCSTCGQQQIERRFTLRAIFIELLNSITNIETGFGKTCVDMVRRPGAVINKYLQGATRDYFKPFRYAFIWATISALLMIYSGVFEEQQMTTVSWLGQREMSPEELEVNQMIQEKIRSFMSFIMLSTVPFNAFGSFLLFRKFQYTRSEGTFRFNYAEHLVMNTFITGTTTMIGIVFVFFYFLNTEYVIISTPISLLVSTLFSAYAFKQVFEISYLNSLWRTLVSVLLSLLMMLVFAVVFGILIGMFFFAIKQ